jgi:hypothetical protein
MHKQKINNKLAKAAEETPAIFFLMEQDANDQFV